MSNELDRLMMDSSQGSDEATDKPQQAVEAQDQNLDLQGNQFFYLLKEPKERLDSPSIPRATETPIITSNDLGSNKSPHASKHSQSNRASSPQKEQSPQKHGTSGKTSSSKLSMDELDKYIEIESSQLAVTNAKPIIPQSPEQKSLDIQKPPPLQVFSWKPSFGEKFGGGRLGVDLGGLIIDYHGYKSMRNQLSDKFDEIEQEHLTHHQLYTSLLSIYQGGRLRSNFGWYHEYKYGTSVPELNQTHLYQDPQIIGQIYGKTLQVSLKPIEGKTSISQGSYRRVVNEDRSQMREDILYYRLCEQMTEGDLARNLHYILTQMANKYRRSIEEIADAFVRLSGDLDALIF